jgi:hypothetical protein
MTKRSLLLTLISSIMVLTICLAGQTDKKQTPVLADAGAANPFGEFRSFSAVLNGGIGRDHDRKIYRSGDLMRLDFENYYRITDLRKLTTQSIHPDRCALVQAPDAGSYPFSAYHDFKIGRSLTGEKETVDGHVCQIENVTFTSTDGRFVTIKMKLWKAEDMNGFPIQIEAEANGIKLTPLHYSNVSLTPPDPKLFQHPAKCLNITQGSQMGTTKKDSAPSRPAPDDKTAPAATQPPQKPQQ